MAPKSAKSKAKAKTTIKTLGAMAKKTIAKTNANAAPKSSGSAPKPKAMPKPMKSMKGPQKGAKYQTLSSAILKGKKGKSMTVAEKIETMLDKDLRFRFGILVV